MKNLNALDASSFSLANSLISADVLSAASGRLLLKANYFQAFSKVSFNINSNKNTPETENLCLREGKNKSDNKKIRVSDLNLGTVGNHFRVKLDLWL